jgi:uncharacterized membrane protein YhaH (DUF805 family)
MANKPLHPIIARVKENMLDKIFDYKGTISVKEFWLFFLSAFVINFFLWWTMAIPVWVGLSVVSALVRRLHDAGKKTLDILYILIPFAGPIIVLIWSIKPTGTYNK